MGKTGPDLYEVAYPTRFFEGEDVANSFLFTVACGSRWIDRVSNTDQAVDCCRF